MSSAGIIPSSWEIQQHTKCPIWEEVNSIIPPYLFMAVQDGCRVGQVLVFPQVTMDAGLDHLPIIADADLPDYRLTPGQHIRVSYTTFEPETTHWVILEAVREFLHPNQTLYKMISGNNPNSIAVKKKKKVTRTGVVPKSTTNQKTTSSRAVVSTKLNVQNTPTIQMGTSQVVVPNQTKPKRKRLPIGPVGTEPFSKRKKRHKSKQGSTVKKIDGDEKKKIRN